MPQPGIVKIYYRSRDNLELVQCELISHWFVFILDAANAQAYICQLGQDKGKVHLAFYDMNDPRAGKIYQDSKLN